MSAEEQKLLEAVQRTPGASLQELRDTLDLPMPQVAEMAERLQDSGLVIKAWDQGQKRLFLPKSTDSPASSSE